jgi:hypothetical protein
MTSKKDCNWVPMTDDDWDWVNGKAPPNPNQK